MTLASFKEKLAALPEITYFDEDCFLREAPSDREKLKELIHEAEKLLAGREHAPSDTIFLKGTLGNLYRIDGQPEKAVHYLQICLDNAIASGETTKQIVFTIRLGEALKYENKHDEALALFNRSVKLCKNENGNGYMDFALQHKGKCLMELDKLDEAEACFLAALEIRQTKGDPALIDSVEQALHVLKQMKKPGFSKNWPVDDS